MRLLEKRPADRHRSAADVVHAIDGLLAPAAVGDLLPTLSTTTDATAATVSGKLPAAPRRRLGLFAGAATAAVALLVPLLLRASGVPDAGQPGAPDDHLSGAEQRARRAARMDHRYAAARRLVSEVGAPLRSAARALCRHGWLQPERWLARCVDMLLSGHRGGAFARFIHRIAGTHRTLGDDIAARLEAAAACLASWRRRRRVPRWRPMRLTGTVIV